MTDSALPHRMNDERLGLLLGLLGVLIFAGTLPVTRIAITSFDPWFVTFARAAMATAVAIPVLWLLGRRFPKKHAFSLFIAGLLLVAGFPGFMALALTTVPAAHGGIVLGILPLATAIFAALLAGERPSPLFWICGAAGTIIITVFALRDGAWGFEAGDFWLVVAGLCASAGYVMSGKLSHEMPGWEVISWALILNAPLTITGALYLWKPEFAHAPASHNIAMLYLGFGSMYFGFFAWNTGLKLGGLSKVGQLQLFQTFFTIVIAALLLGEPVTTETWLFAVAIFVVVWLGRKSQVNQKTAPTS